MGIFYKSDYIVSIGIIEQVGEAYRVVQKRIPSFRFGITSVIQHRF